MLNVRKVVIKQPIRTCTGNASNNHYTQNKVTLSNHLIYQGLKRYSQTEIPSSGTTK